MTLLHGRGYLPDPQEVRDRRPGFHILKRRLQARGLLTGTLAASVSWASKVLASAGGPGILNQTQTGACTGHASAGAITTRFSIANTPIKLVSPIGPYFVGRRMSQQPNPDGSFPPLTDDGAEPSQVVAGISEYGVTSAATWGNYPADPATINDEPTLEQIEAISDFELVGAYFLQSTGNQFLIDLMTALQAGYPVTNAIEADTDEFQNYTGGILGPQGVNLDHYTYMIGYEFDGQDPMSMIGTFVNSWGPTDGVNGGRGWGENGFYRMNAAGILQFQDCAVFDVKPAPGSVGEQ